MATLGRMPTSKLTAVVTANMPQKSLSTSSGASWLACDLEIHREVAMSEVGSRDAYHLVWIEAPAL